MMDFIFYDKFSAAHIYRSFCAATVVSLCMLPCGATAYANEASSFICPAVGDPSEVITCYDTVGQPKPGFPKTTPKPFNDGVDVNGDGKKDVLGTSMADVAGNRLECWCLQQSATISQRFGYAFVPNGEGRKWFGGCFFPNGQNEIHCEGAVVEEGPDRGKVSEYQAVYQFNYDPPPTGTDGYLFCHSNSGDNKGKNQKFKLKLKWKKTGQKPNGDPVYEMEVIEEPVVCPEQNPPVDPNGVLASLGPTSGTDTMVATLGWDDPVDGMWAYALIFPNPPATGGAIGIEPRLISVGDTIVLTGSGITNAKVNDPAASPLFGGWQIKTLDAEHITFVATVAADLTPLAAEGEPVAVSGFSVFAPDSLPGSARFAITLDTNVTGGRVEAPVLPNKTPTLPLGDVTADGKTDIVDVQCEILTVLAVLADPPAAWPVCAAPATDAADSNCDGDINVTDVLTTISGLLGSPFPSELDINADGFPDACQCPENGCSAVPAQYCLAQDDGSPCDDNNPCTLSDRCIGGTCTGPLSPCTDADPCTDNLCSGDGVCEVETLPDETPCGPDDICMGGVCVQAAPPCQTAADCKDDNPCTEDDCVSGKCVHTTAAIGKWCELDGDQCTIEACVGTTCAVKEVVSLCPSDGKPCTYDLCDPYEGCAYNHLPNFTPCGEVGHVCISGECVPEIKPECYSSFDCEDGSLCTLDFCSGGFCYSKPDNDGGICELNQTNKCIMNHCFNGQCVKEGLLEICPSDGNPCTNDFCQSDVGCLLPYPKLPDGTSCGKGLVCKDGTCISGVCATDADCSDNNVCTQDVCNPLMGCAHSAISGSCDDLNGCTVNDFCFGGICTPGLAKDCNDNNPATQDSCSNGQCVHTPILLSNCCKTHSGSGCDNAACQECVCAKTPLCCSSGLWSAICVNMASICQPCGFCVGGGG